MLCPVCGGPSTKVLDSRDAQGGRAVRRRRKCQACGHRFTTHERIEETLPLVIKRGGEREPFDREKILQGLKIACRKRPVELVVLEDVVRQIVQWAATRGKSEIPSPEIGERIMHHLHDLDPVAYVRFVSVYRSFETVEEFERLLREMEKAESVDMEGQRKLFERLEEGGG